MTLDFMAHFETNSKIKSLSLSLSLSLSPFYGTSCPPKYLNYAFINLSIVTMVKIQANHNQYEQINQQITTFHYKVIDLRNLDRIINA